MKCPGWTRKDPDSFLLLNTFGTRPNIIICMLKKCIFIIVPYNGFIGKGLPVKEGNFQKPIFRSLWKD